MDEQASVSISLREGKLEIRGSEDFVKEQLDRFQDLIDGKLAALPTTPPPATPVLATSPGGQADAGASNPLVPGTNPFPNVLAIEEDGIKILKTLPGKKKAEKTVNAALLCLVGADIRGEATVPFSIIREVCKHHSCLDSSNFAATMKAEKELFIISGPSKNLTAKLTHPGKGKAMELAKALNGNDP